MTYLTLSDDDEENAACLAAANAFTAPLDAKITEFAKTWNPTGVFPPADVDQIIAETTALLQKVRSTVAVAPTWLISDADAMKRNELSRLDSAIAGFAKFSTVSATAKTTGSLVSAPDLKQYVVNAMLRASNGYVTASVLLCKTINLMEYFASAQAQIDFVIFAVEKFAGVVAGVADKILQVPKDLAALLDKVIKVSMLAGGAYLAYKLFFEKTSRR